MGKGKSANPADAFRKAARKKELKKNKAERAKARDFALVKKDTSEIEDEIRILEEIREHKPAEKARLRELQAELERINKKKAEYVEEHPEQRKLVYRPRKQQQDGRPQEELILQKRSLFDKNGLPKRPERSIYYDPKMNPFGVPPPGAPYMERALLPGEVESEAEEDDDEVVMPEGPPPGAENVDSDDEIVMPDELTSGDPPRGRAQPSDPIQAPFLPAGLPPLPPGPPPLPSVAAWPAGIPPPPPNLPPPPPGFPSKMLPPSATAFIPPLPPPPPGFPSGFTLPSYPGSAPRPGGHRPSHHFPPPPPGFFPPSKALPFNQDPLSSIPHQIYQAHKAQKTVNHPPLPTNPTRTLAAQKPTDAAVASATISAEPELRDLKREATSFIPTTVKRRKVAGSGSSRVNAAPTLAATDELNSEAEQQPARPDLLGTLSAQFGPAPKVSLPETKAVRRAPAQKDDYEKFVSEMGDVLEPADRK